MAPCHKYEHGHYDHFNLTGETADNLGSPDVPRSSLCLHPDLMRRLDRARAIAGIPFVITSGFRSREHNATVGGISTSSHLRGLAVDIRCRDDRTAVRMIAALAQAGFQRIGWHREGRFIHVDIDDTKPTPAYWTY